ncbi:hypothetical protein LWI28_007354 [Acer negundo]|uniref:Uncharacterized protein n=1 Tax=Acer negundo TaxID=4023 RepID=A0AAD5IDJ3_ACENE|nr:hypothetical protein LWI28_007354 [Acer negundo]
MAVTDDKRRRTLFDEDQKCYRTSSGNRELCFGRGCVQTSVAVDGGRNFALTPLFSGPSDREREYRKWSAHKRICSPPPSHRIQRGQTHENLIWTNSNSKPRPTLPKGRPTTLVDMMRFVSDWFDFEENENDCCDESRDGVVDCDNSVREKVVDCLDVVKNVEENVKNEICDDGKIDDS